MKEKKELKFNENDLTKNLLDLNLEEDEKANKNNYDRRYRRLHSTYLSTRPKLFLEEKEDILMILNQKQHKINDYSQNKESISLSERQNAIQWGLKILELIDLEEIQKTSIFHRFCTAYDYTSEKLFLLNKPVKDQDELKILIINIFLLSYKIEGFSLAKITISNLIEVLMKESKIKKNELIDKISNNEMKILELLDYKPQIFEDNNIHQLSYILLDLFIKKYSLKLNQNEEKKFILH